MKKKTMAAAALISSLGIAGACTPPTAAAQQVPDDTNNEIPDYGKPNMVLFISDDCTFSNLGCYGSPDSKTPNIDRLASQGMLFERAYQSSAVSSPTRHNLYTGIWPMKSGAYPNHTMANPGTKSIIHHLRPAGYRVALVGKSHVEPAEVFPWDTYVNFNGNSELNFNAINNFVKKCKDDGVPFCLFVASSEPHSAWNKGDASQFDPTKVILPPMYVDIPETREAYVRYLAEINYMDAQVGRVMDILDNNGVADKSAMIFTSEQGNSLPFAKWTCYDQGVHTAMIVRWPGVVSPGVRSDAMVEYVDIVPTFIEMAGAQAQGPLDGESIIPVLDGSKTEHKTYTYSQHTTRGIIAGSEYYGTRSVADKKYRYIINFTPEVKFKNTETNSNLFKLWIKKGEAGDVHAQTMTHNYQWRPARELYDTEKDPYCMNNLTENPGYAKEIARLDKELKAWMDECGDLGQETEMDALNHKPKGASGASR